jgi:hypothetical protein
MVINAKPSILQPDDSGDDVPLQSLFDAAFQYVPGDWTYVAPLGKAGWPRGRESPVLLSLPPSMPYSFPGASRCIMIFAARIVCVPVMGC